MKTACKTLKWSLGITSLSLLLSIFLFILSSLYNVTIVNFLLNLFIGVFSSSIVTLLISIPNYIVARKQLLEKYWEETRRLITSIYSIEYLDIEFNKEDFIGYINKVEIMNGKYDSYVLYLGIEDNQDLKKLQKLFYQKFSKEHYNPENFIFHMTLHIDKDYKIIKK